MPTTKKGKLSIFKRLYYQPIHLPLKQIRKVKQINMQALQLDLYTKGKVTMSIYLLKLSLM